jgi:predicted nucleic acid-binding protein
MPVRVVDASVVAAIVFGEPEAVRAAALVGEDELVAPSLLRYEVANIAWKKSQRLPKQADVIARALRLSLDLDVRYLEVDYEDVLALALEKRITAYDASYLWLSRALKAPLATLDSKLAAAAR